MNCHGFPGVLLDESAGSDEDVQMGVKLSRAAIGLQHHHAADVQWLTDGGLEDVSQTGIPGSHQLAKQVGTLIEPAAEEVGGGQHEMAIGDARQQAAADEIGPLRHPRLGAAEAETGFAGEGNPASFAAEWAAVLHAAHLLRVAAVEHLLDGRVVVRRVESGIPRLEGIPMIPEDLFERVCVHAAHGCPLEEQLTRYATHVQSPASPGTPPRPKSPGAAG